MMIRRKKNTGQYLLYFLMILIIFAAFGCGNSGDSNSGSNSGTGSYAAKLVFPPDIPRSGSDSDTAASNIDCTAAGIATINCALFSADGSQIAETNWQCSRGSGIVNNLPLGNGITIVVTAEDADGLVLLRGEEQDVTIAAGQPTEGNEIRLQWANIPIVTAGSEPKTLVFDWTHIDFHGDVDHYQLQVDPDGDDDAYQFSPIEEADHIQDTTFTLTVPVHLTDWVNTIYRVAALDAEDNEVAVSNDVDLMTTVLSEEVIGYFKASNTDAEDMFGYSIAISADGGTLAVGAAGEASSATDINGEQQDNIQYGSGAVYVFVIDSSGNWQQQAYLKASNSSFGAMFGAALAMSADGNTLAVGAGLEGSTIERQEVGSGGVYIFTRDESDSWSEQALLKANNAESEDHFGISVALSSDGNTLAVGAEFKDISATESDPDQADNRAENAGAVYIFRRTSGTIWDQEAYINAGNPDDEDQFGHCVALSSNGNILAVGAPYEDSAATGTRNTPNEDDDDNAPDSGAVYIFSRYSDTLWIQEAYLKASNGGQYDSFGVSVALSSNGNILAAGAVFEESAATGPNSNGQDDNRFENGAGAVYVFSRSTMLWRQQAYLKASNTGEGDAFGKSVSLSSSGDLLAVGAFGESSTAVGINGAEENNDAFKAGAVYIFNANNDLWRQTAYVKASNSRGDTSFGLRVALSQYGATLAVGAMSESGSASGINGDQEDYSLSNAGAVYLY